MKDTSPLHTLPDDELLLRLSELVSQARRDEADLVVHIGEAYMRIRVARASRRHPVLLDMLRDGRLSVESSGCCRC